MATGIVTAGTGIGTVIAGLTIPVILQTYGPEGWRYTWYYLGGGLLLISILIALFVRSRPEEKGLPPVGETEPTTDQRASTPVRQAISWQEVYRRPSVWFLGMVYFMYGFSYIIYMTFFAAYLIKEVGLTREAASGLWAMVGGLSILCGVIWGGLSDRLGRSRGAVLAYVTLTFSYLLFASIKNPWGYYASALLFGLSAWSLPTIMAATAGDLVGPRLASAGLGFITLFFGVGQALGPAVGGWLSDRFQSFAFSFVLAGGVSLLGAVLALRIQTSPKP